MSFVLTDDQQALRDTAMEFMRREAPLSHLRQLRDSDSNGKDATLRSKLAENGFFAVIIAADADPNTDDAGEHFGLTGIGQVLEAQGRQLAATPLLQTCLLYTSPSPRDS